MTTTTIKMTKNYTSYALGDTGTLWKSADALAGTGVLFEVSGQRYQTRGTRFIVNFWDANCVSRQVTGGPVTQEPHATLSAQAVCIYSGPRRPEPKTITVTFGDLIVCPELDLVVRVVDGGRWADPKLEILSCKPATEDHSELVAARN